MTSRYFAAFCFQRAEEQAGSTRAGFTIPRAVGKAVIRNRIRRRMREAVRLYLPKLPANWSIVFNPRRTVLDAPFEDLQREIGRIVERCNERS
jgi:ribonuclease P protein component